MWEEGEGYAGDTWESGEWGWQEGVGGMGGEGGGAGGSIVRVV